MVFHCVFYVGNVFAENWMHNCLKIVTMWRKCWYDLLHVPFCNVLDQLALERACTYVLDNRLESLLTLFYALPSRQIFGPFFFSQYLLDEFKNFDWPTVITHHFIRQTHVLGSLCITACLFAFNKLFLRLWASKAYFFFFIVLCFTR